VAPVAAVSASPQAESDATQTRSMNLFSMDLSSHDAALNRR
jgi:hypothetical protein